MFLFSLHYGRGFLIASWKQCDRDCLSFQQTLAEFRKQSTKAKDADVKSFVSQTLPTLEDHLKMAEQTQTALGGARATAGKPGGSTSTPKGTGGTEPKEAPGAPQSPQR